MIVMIKGSWYKVPECILTDKGLTLADAACFAFIAQRADNKAVELSTELIAAEIGYSSRTVTAAVRKLSERNYIAVETRKGKPSVYRQLLLAPRKQGKPRSSYSTTPDADVSKYECVINQFPESEKEVG